MLKLIAAFKACPSPANRVRLQTYLNKHTFAIVCAPHQAEFLKANGFQI